MISSGRWEPSEVGLRVCAGITPQFREVRRGGAEAPRRLKPAPPQPLDVTLLLRGLFAASIQDSCLTAGGVEGRRVKFQAAQSRARSEYRVRDSSHRLTGVSSSPISGGTR